ncbi:AI-2E family transporter [Candidatus Woesearchaeota archaeon]|nr:AI-2E family transporter [Candidatus Woesearchaeota archaeon]
MRKFVKSQLRKPNRGKHRKVRNIKLTIRYSVVLLILLTILSALIIRSLFKTVLAGIILSYIFYPVYGAVYSRLRMKTVSALLITVLILVLITVPSFFVINKLSNEASVAFVVAKQYLEGGSKAIQCGGDGLCQLIPANLKDASPKVKAVLTNTLGKGTEYIVNKTTQAILSLPSIALNLFIVFFIMYYMFKDGTGFVEAVKNILPVRKQRQDALIGQFSQVASAVIYGTVIVAVLQGALAGIGFYLFGVPSPIIWGVITAVVSLIPFLGPYIVWFPASLLLMASGYYSGEGLIFLRGLGLFFYGLLLVSGVDNVLKPRIIGRKAKIHPVLVFLGIIGGVNFFGLVGFVVGPVIIAMLKTAFEAYVKERAQPADSEE